MIKICGTCEGSGKLPEYSDTMPLAYVPCHYCDGRGFTDDSIFKNSVPDKNQQTLNSFV